MKGHDAGHIAAPISKGAVPAVLEAAFLRGAAGTRVDREHVANAAVHRSLDVVVVEADVEMVRVGERDDQRPPRSWYSRNCSAPLRTFRRIVSSSCSGSVVTTLRGPTFLSVVSR